MKQPSSNSQPSLAKSILIPTAAGFLVIAAAFGGFGYWAVTAPISGAALASGKVGPENSRQRVQHLEGGVVKSIHVRDGAQVKPGQELVILDDTKARAQLLAQRILSDSLKARQFRLETELEIYRKRESKGSLQFPHPLLDAAEQRQSTKKLLDVEHERFRSRLEALQSAATIHRQTITGYKSEIIGLRAELEAIGTQLSLINEENVLYEGLRKRGLELQSKVLNAQRVRAQSEQLKAERESRITKLEAEVETTQLKLKDLWAVRLDEVSSELATIAQELLASQEQIRAYEDTLARTVITSPVGGTLISLKVNTKGGVIAPGETVVEIVPAKDALTIEAKLSPNDIDVVQPGQKASITLLAYPQRNLPKIYGELRSVSADSLVDENTGDAYYLAKIEMKEEELKKLGDDVKLVPGMTVQVMVETTSRTFFDYVMSPVFDTADRAFKEQ